VEVGDDPSSPIPVAPVAPWGAPHDDELEIELAPGPRADWFAASAHRTLFESVWTASNDADRIGLRLDGPDLPRAREGELPSEGMVPGAIQVPPSGRPTILLADGPVTGGYPVIAVVTDAALDLLAQARPGTRIRFRHARPA
jgi:allophanate hydrolase subunit 2